MTLEQVKIVAEIVVAITAIITLMKGVYEYTKQAAQKRAEHFIKMRDRYDSFFDICSLLEKDGSSERARQELSNLLFERKRAFLGFYEESALMMQSGLIKKKVAHYMFGYYAIRCWSNRAFWDTPNSTLNRDSEYWGLFRTFVQTMEKSHIESLSAEHRFERYRI